METQTDLLFDSGSGCIIINMSLAREIMLNCAQSQWSEKKPMELKSFSNDIVQPLGTLKTPVKCDDWSIQKAKITVVADGFRPILGRDLFDQLGITISQKPCPQTEVNNILCERSDIEIEVNKNKLGKEAMKRQKEDPNKESRLISHPDVGQSIPRRR